MTSRRCPRCGIVYQEEARFCPKDGTPLVEVAARVPGASGPTSKTDVRRAVAPRPGATLDPAGTLTHQILDARYEIQRKLGEGGMSFVYQAKDLHTGQSVAIKVLSPRLNRDQSSVERLRREAGLAMRLDHPNVCRILRLGETEEGLIYLVMPYLEGELLSDREVKHGPMDPQPGVAILVQVCAGLQHAHELQIIHRDLKPENIMLVPQADGTERAMIMDFGLAKEKRADPSIAKLTATGIILGTPEFMSPEQIRGRPVDARSDIYALGIVGFELFTGKLPFQGRNAQEMMIARLKGRPTPLRQVRPEFPARLEQVLMRCMEGDPERRYSDARQFGRALLEAIDSPVPGWVRSLVD